MSEDRAVAIKHGTTNAYAYHKCRCDDCRAAMKAAKVKARDAYYASDPTPDQLKECERCGEQFRRHFGDNEAKWAARRFCSQQCNLAEGRSVRWGSDPHAVGRRTLLARTCRECGLLLDGSRFGKTRGGRRGGVCTTCRSRITAVQISEEQRQAYYAQRNAHANRLNDETREFASRHGYQWTGVELEIVATRGDLSTTELAEMLGRTRCAVRHMKHNLRVDPRKYLAAGT